MSLKLKLFYLIPFSIFLIVFLSGCDALTKKEEFSVPVKAVYYKVYNVSGIDKYLLGVKLDLSDIPVDEVYSDDYYSLFLTEGTSIISAENSNDNMYNVFFSPVDTDSIIEIDSAYDKIVDAGKKVYFDTDDETLYYEESSEILTNKVNKKTGHISTSEVYIDYSMMP